MAEKQHNALMPLISIPILIIISERLTSHVRRSLQQCYISYNNQAKAGYNKMLI